MSEMMRRGIAVTFTVYLPDDEYTVDDSEMLECADGAARDIVHAALRGITDDTFDAASYDAFVGRNVRAQIITHGGIARPDDDVDVGDWVDVRTFDASA